MANLLVIDDEADIRDGLRDLLVSRGHSVIEAGDGAEGLMQLAGNDIDLVLVDIIMPSKEGIETIKEIRRMSPEVRIVAMSGHPSKDFYLDLASRLGANAVLCKPFQPAELSKTMLRALGEPFLDRRSDRRNSVLQR